MAFQAEATGQYKGVPGMFEKIKISRVAEIELPNRENYRQRDQRDYEELNHVGLCRSLMNGLILNKMA